MNIAENFIFIRTNDHNRSRPQGCCCPGNRRTLELPRLCPRLINVVNKFPASFAERWIKSSIQRSKLSSRVKLMFYDELYQSTRLRKRFAFMDDRSWLNKGNTSAAPEIPAKHKFTGRCFYSRYWNSRASEIPLNSYKMPRPPTFTFFYLRGNAWKQKLRLQRRRNVDPEKRHAECTKEGRGIQLSPDKKRSYAEKCKFRFVRNYVFAG